MYSAIQLQSYFSLSKCPVYGENMIWFTGCGKVTVIPAIGGGTLAFLKDVIETLPETNHNADQINFNIKTHTDNAYKITSDRKINKPKKQKLYNYN